MSFKSIRDFDLNDKRVLVRADLNVPVKNGTITDTARIDRLKPTIHYLREAGAKILILSHFGRPEGEQNPAMSLAFLAAPLAKSWDCDVQFCQSCIGEQARNAARNLKPGDVLLLENVRFHKGEKKNDPAFAKELAALGDIFVNDAFSAAHRAHASTEGLAHLLPSAAGLLMEAELHALNQALENPEKPVAAITGGSKISTKLKVLNNLISKTDILVLGGGMANTFIHALGGDVGNSLCEKDMAEEARMIFENAKNQGCEIVLPEDSVVVDALKPGAAFDVVPSKNVPAGKMAVDIGPDSIKSITEKLEGCKTVLWNGPVGVFEIPPFDKGTNLLARNVAAMTKEGKIVSVAGGGDTSAALENAGVSDSFSYISAAGGAFLEWLEGSTLPGVAALMKKEAA